MILVTGASGITGLAVITRLAAAGLAVRALSRGGEASERVRAAGACEVVEGRFDAPTLRRACAGASGLYHICPNVHPDEVAIGAATIDAAVAEGVGHFVFHSVIRPQLRAMPHHWAKLEVEALLATSGLDYTILQPTVYMQNLRFQWRDVIERGEYGQPYRASARLTLVDLDDVAEAALQVLTVPVWRNATFELVGTAPLDRHAMTAVLAAETGREVRAVEIDRDQWQRETERRLGAEPTARLRAMFDWYDIRGLPAGCSRVLAMLLGREPATFDAFVRRMIAQDGAA
jgi:NAD(P)H dehydrogenase (quinone)